MRTFTLLALLLLAHASMASAQAVKLEFVNGRVNLSTQNAPIRAILAEWTRLGGTKIVNAERVTGTPMTLELQGVPERQALDVVLRNVAGYMIAAREVAGTGASRFDRVMILPTSTAPRRTGHGSKRRRKSVTIPRTDFLMLNRDHPETTTGAFSKMR